MPPKEEFETKGWEGCSGIEDIVGMPVGGVGVVGVGEGGEPSEPMGGVTFCGELGGCMSMNAFLTWRLA
ncbi:MAG TPA: hypothetical protein VLH84_05445 [Patescibacteria group bacterium]|nr:hypothetical protein [Patescibacteria group bacterium]